MKKYHDEKQSFETPELDILCLTADDVIATSSLEIKNIGDGDIFEWSELLPPSIDG